MRGQALWKEDLAAMTKTYHKSSSFFKELLAIFQSDCTCEGGINKLLMDYRVLTRHWPYFLELEKTLCWERLKEKEKGTTEDEMVGWHYWIKGHEFEQTPEMVKDRKAWCAVVHGLTKTQTLLSNWTTTAGLMFTCHHTVSSMRQSWTWATCGHSDQYLSNCTGPSDVFLLRESYSLDFNLGRRTVLRAV